MPEKVYTDAQGRYLCTLTIPEKETPMTDQQPCSHGFYHAPDTECVCMNEEAPLPEPTPEPADDWETAPDDTQVCLGAAETCPHCQTPPDEEPANWKQHDGTDFAALAEYYEGEPPLLELDDIDLNA